PVFPSRHAPPLPPAHGEPGRAIVRAAHAASFRAAHPARRRAAHAAQRSKRAVPGRLLRSKTRSVRGSDQAPPGPGEAKMARGGGPGFPGKSGAFLRFSLTGTVKPATDG